MFCRKCGAKIDDGSKFCMKCGEGIKLVGEMETHFAEIPVQQPVDSPVEEVKDYSGFIEYVGECVKNFTDCSLPKELLDSTLPGQPIFSKILRIIFAVLGLALYIYCAKGARVIWYVILFVFIAVGSQLSAFVILFIYYENKKSKKFKIYDVDFMNNIASYDGLLLFLNEFMPQLSTGFSSWHYDSADKVAAYGSGASVARAINIANGLLNLNTVFIGTVYVGKEKKETFIKLRFYKAKTKGSKTSHIRCSTGVFINGFCPIKEAPYFRMERIAPVIYGALKYYDEFENK